MARTSFRVEPDQGNGLGHLIDRERVVRFRFDGRSYQGYAGDTLASALLANGVRVFGWSPRLQRPRGIMGAGAEEVDGRVMLRVAGGREMAVQATETPLYEGLRARSIRATPAARLLAGPLRVRLGAMMRAGAEFKTFKAPGRISWDLFEPIARRLTNGAPAPQGTAGGRYEHFHLHCDVLVAGGGIAGICAARKAAAGGARVVLCEQAPRFGGLADIYSARIEGEPAIAWMRQQCAALARANNVQLLANTRIAGTLASGEVAAVERCLDPGPQWFAATGNEEAVRERVWRISAKRIILATGAVERGFLFANNDRPGLMMASAARAHLYRHGVIPGRKGVIYTNNDDAYRTAVLLRQAGVEIARIVDTRPNPDGIAIGHAMAAGLHLSFGAAVSELETIGRGTRITGVRIVPTTRAAARTSAAEPVSCDFVCMSAGWDPVLPAAGATAGEWASPQFDEDRQIFLPGTSGRQIAVGAANGTFALGDIIAEASEAGMAAAWESPFAHRPPVPREKRGGSGWEHRFAPASWTVYPPEESGEADRHFVDLRADLTVADIKLAVREGYWTPAQLRRYIGLDGATGRQAPHNINALAVIAAASGTPLARLANRWARPVTDLSVGALAGFDLGRLGGPERQLPLAGQHTQEGALFRKYDDWNLPHCYPRKGETREKAVVREAVCLRQGVGVMDLTARGKFELAGPQAAELLAGLVDVPATRLGIGECRLAAIHGDHGGMIDVAIAGRLDASRYLLLTAAEVAPIMKRRIASLVGNGLQRWRVLVSDESEHWAHLALAGPRARELLRWLPVRTSDWDDAGLPPGGLAEMQFGGHPLRVLRIGDLGELQYELAISASHASSLWLALSEAGKKAGLMPVGMGARDLVLMEMGRNRRVTGDGGRKVVGLLSEDPQELLTEGARIMLDDALGESSVIAHVAASEMGPNLGRSMALAAIADGHALIGRQVRIASQGGDTFAEVVDPVFHEQARQDQDG